MDGWKYTAKCGRKESGFENLKTRFQDCNLSRKQESKPDGMIERKQSAKKTNCLCGMNEKEEERKETVCLCRMMERKEARKKEAIPSFGLSVWNERKQSVKLYGWKTIKKYHYNSVLQ
jgi:hypothetical protein